MPVFGNRTVFSNHFLETGNIWLVLIDEVDHLVLYFGMFFILQRIKLCYIPAHHP